MAEITRRRTGELLRRLFEVLMPHPEGLPAREALQAVANSVKLSEYEAGKYEAGDRRFETIIRYATVDVGKAGWLVKGHGRWTVTEEGCKAYKAFPDSEAFYRRAAQLYNEWKKNQDRGPDGGPDIGVDRAPGGEKARITFEQAEEQAWAEVAAYVQTMPPYEFQELVASLLRAMGYHIGWVAPPGKDGGVDVLAFNDPLGTKPPRIKVQVKRQEQRVSVDGLRSFMAVLGADDVGIFVNTGGFTRDAEDEVRSQQSRRVTLLNLERLFDLWIEHQAQLDEPARRRLPLQPIYFLAPEV